MRKKLEILISNINRVVDDNSIDKMMEKAVSEAS